MDSTCGMKKCCVLVKLSLPAAIKSRHWWQGGDDSILLCAGAGALWGKSTLLNARSYCGAFPCRYLPIRWRVIK